MSHNFTDLVSQYCDRSQVISLEKLYYKKHVSCNLSFPGCTCENLISSSESVNLNVFYISQKANFRVKVV